MSNLYWLTEAQIKRLKPFFPKSHGKPRVDDRRVLSGIIFINRNGLRWCDAPAEDGPAKTLCNRWKRWRDKGVFARIMAGLAAEGAGHKTIMIDATYLKAHPLPGSTCKACARGARPRACGQKGGVLARSGAGRVA
jgi:transposase